MLRSWFQQAWLGNIGNCAWSASTAVQLALCTGERRDRASRAVKVVGKIKERVALHEWTDLEDHCPLTLEYLEGGKARNFWEIFPPTTRNITPPHMFFWASKRSGGGSSGALNSTRTWRDHYKPETFSWNISRCGGGHPPFLKYFSF